MVLQEGAPARIGPTPSTQSFDVVTWLTIYLVLLLAVPSRLVVGPLGSAGAPSMLVGLASLGIWAVILLVRRRSADVLHFSPMRWALLALIVSCAISYVLAMSRPINEDEISPADVAMLSLMSWAGTMLLASDGIQKKRRIDDLVWRIVLATGALGLLGLAQFVLEQPIVDLIRIPGLTELAPAELFVRNGLVRPSGTATHPIEYGAILAMALPLTLHVAFQHTHRKVLLRWPPVLVITAVIAISGSRSAYLCALAGVVVCLFAWTPVLRRWMISLALIGFVLVALLVPRMLRLLVTLFDDPANDTSITSRTDSFDLAWAFVVEHPLFGRGFGTFLPKYRIFDNQFLALLVSGGLVGVLALLALGFVALREMRRMARMAPAADAVAARDLAGSLSGAVVAGFVGMAFFDAFSFPMTMGTLFLILGIIGALSRLNRDAAAGGPPLFADSLQPVGSAGLAPPTWPEQVDEGGAAGLLAQGGPTRLAHDESQPEQYRRQRPVPPRVEPGLVEHEERPQSR